jgi:hypothetical protein
MNSVRLGPGDRTQAKALFALMADVFEEDRGDLSDAYVDRLLGRGDFWAIAAFVGDEVIGGITVSLRQACGRRECAVFSARASDGDRRSGRASGWWFWARRWRRMASRRIRVDVRLRPAPLARFRGPARARRPPAQGPELLQGEEPVPRSRRAAARDDRARVRGPRRGELARGLVDRLQFRMLVRRVVSKALRKRASFVLAPPEVTPGPDGRCLRRDRVARARRRRPRPERRPVSVGRARVGRPAESSRTEPPVSFWSWAFRPYRPNAFGCTVPNLKGPVDHGRFGEKRQCCDARVCKGPDHRRHVLRGRLQGGYAGISRQHHA